MTTETHLDLAHEFPEFKAEIHALKLNDGHFRRLFDGYEALVKELHRSDGAISDEHAEDLKKRRLDMKDELYKMLKAKKGDGGGKACCG